MKLCMIGTRGHNNYVFGCLEELPGVKLSGICGSDESECVLLASQCEQIGCKPEKFSNYREMFDAVKPDIVSIAGPMERHAEMCVEALNRKINVFCEKPIALTLEELDMIKKAYSENGFPHLVSMQGLRYEPAFLAAWNTVQNGGIGKVKLITAQKSYRLGTRPEFYKRRETYGGTIPWVGSHAIDWIYWFSGAGFKLVYAVHTAEDNFDHGDLEIAALCQFTMNNGVLASCNIDFLRPGKAPTHGDDRIRLAGTKGIVEVIDGKANLINQDGVSQLECKENPRLFTDFVRHVQGKSKALIDARQTFDLTEACLLARESADTGKPVCFP